jgi:DNA (cytosine-5)-methyltransferase 1
MRELHLFAGAGGGILGGLLLGHRPVCAVEIDPYCRRVLRARQADGYLPAEMEIHDDVRTFDGGPWRGRVDVVAGGFPCQDISVAGKGAGLAGARSGLWWEMHRIICEVGPSYVFVENVAALTSRGLDAVLGSLADLGFDAEWQMLSAADCGAPHLRKRLWILARMADTDCRRREQRESAIGSFSVADASGADVPDAASGQDLGRERGVVAQAEGGRQGGDAAAVVGRADDPDADGRRRKGGEASRLRHNQPRGDAHGLCQAADADGELREEQRQPEPSGAARACIERGGWWQAEPALGRVADGMADRVGQLRALGNGQVAVVAASAWRILEQRLMEAP